MCFSSETRIHICAVTEYQLCLHGKDFCVCVKKPVCWKGSFDYLLATMKHFNWWKAVELYILWSQDSLSLKHFDSKHSAENSSSIMGSTMFLFFFFFLECASIMPCPQPWTMFLDLINALRLASLGIFNFVSLHWHLKFSFKTFWRS